MRGKFLIGLSIFNMTQDSQTRNKKLGTSTQKYGMAPDQNYLIKEKHKQPFNTDITTTDRKNLNASRSVRGLYRCKKRGEHERQRKAPRNHQEENKMIIHKTFKL